jgi:hypothetical protein
MTREETVQVKRVVFALVALDAIGRPRSVPPAA